MAARGGFVVNLVAAREEGLVFNLVAARGGFVVNLVAAREEGLVFNLEAARGGFCYLCRCKRRRFSF